MQFEPGSGWAYSSPGYVLLAHIVETVAGVRCPSFLRSDVLEPLELLQTSAAEPPDGAHAARGSRAGAPARSFDLGSVSVGAGDVWATTADLARWPRALASSGLLSGPSRAAIFSQQAAIADEQEGFTNLGYSYGWFTARYGGRRLVFHPGDQSGFTSLLVWAPELELLIALLAADEIDVWPLVLPALTDLLADST